MQIMFTASPKAVPASAEDCRAFTIYKKDSKNDLPPKKAKGHSKAILKSKKLCLNQLLVALQYHQGQVF